MNRITAEREMAVGEIKSRLEGQSCIGPGLHDAFLKNGVFKLGLRTQSELENAIPSLRSLR